MLRFCIRLFCLLTLMELAACAPLPTPATLSPTPAGTGTAASLPTHNAQVTGTALRLTALAASSTPVPVSTVGPDATATLVPPAIPQVTATVVSPQSTPPPPTPTPTLPEVTPGYTPYAERLIAPYTIRLWHPGLGVGMYDIATISQAGQPDIRLESVEALGNLPAADISGEGYADVMFQTYGGGSHCCWGTVVYNLGPVPAKVLEVWSSPYYPPRTGRGIFQDLDGNGTYEFITYDPLEKGIPCTSPDVKVILRYEPGRGYVGASPDFAALYADEIAAHTRQAEEEIEQSQSGYKCGVYQVVVVDYLYSGQPDRVWAELRRLYLAPDVEDFRTQLAQAVSQGRFFVGAVTP